MPSPNDYVIDKHVATSDRDGVTTIYTLRKFADQRQIDGPWTDEEFAKQKAVDLAAKDLVDAWIEVSPQNGIYTLIQP